MESRKGHGVERNGRNVKQDLYATVSVEGETKMRCLQATEEG